jgi:hypothetical protein
MKEIEKEHVKDLEIILIEALPWRFIFDDKSKNYPWNLDDCIDFYDEPGIKLDWKMHARPKPKEIVNYLKISRLAFTSNGDRVKYNEADEIEWILFPRYG